VAHLGGGQDSGSCTDFYSHGTELPAARRRTVTQAKGTMSRSGPLWVGAAGWLTRPLAAEKAAMVQFFPTMKLLHAMGLGNRPPRIPAAVIRSAPTVAGYAPIGPLLCARSAALDTL